MFLIVYITSLAQIETTHIAETFYIYLDIYNIFLPKHFPIDIFITKQNIARCTHLAAYIYTHIFKFHIIHTLEIVEA